MKMNKGISKMRRNPPEKLYAVVLRGGSISTQKGKQIDGLHVVKEGLTNSEAKDTAKIYNSRLSKGEKVYYKMKYLVKPMLKINPPEKWYAGVYYKAYLPKTGEKVKVFKTKKQIRRSLFPKYKYVMGPYNTKWEAEDWHFQGTIGLD